MAIIDPRLYGGEIQTPANIPVSAGVGAGQAGSEFTPSTGLASPAEAFVGTAVEAQGLAVQREGLRPVAPYLASLRAGVLQTDTAALYARATSPSFAYQKEPLDVYQLFQQLDFVPTPDEEDFLKNIPSNNVEEWAYKVDRVRSLREMQQATGDHWSAGLLGNVLGDAAYLATGAGSVAVASRLGRAAGVAAGAAQGAAIQAGVVGASPRSTEEIVFGMAGEMAAGLFVVNKAGKLVPKDPDFPTVEVAQIVESAKPGKPRVRQVSPAEFKSVPSGVVNADGTLEMIQVKTKDAVWEEVPQALHPTANTTPAEVVAAVDAQIEKSSQSWGARVGRGIQWNTHKTMSSFGPVGQKIANLLVDNNSDLSYNSVESIAKGVKNDLMGLHLDYSDKLRTAMAEDGFGLRQQIFKTGDAMAHQRRIHEEVKMEMFRREQMFRQGKPIADPRVPARITALADSLDALHKRAADELVAAGVHGADALKHYPGYFSRRWSAGSITAATDKFMAAGQDAMQAHRSVVKIVASGMRRANGWDDKLAYNVAAETVNRALRKGVYEDAPYVSGGAELAAQVRDSLKSIGVTGTEAQRVIDVIVGKQDEAGKVGFLKHRIDIDYKAGAVVNGELVRVADLIDNNVTDIVGKYIEGTSAQVAFARKGLTKASDISALRAELMEATKRNPAQQREAKELFDGLVAKLRGEPTGPDLGRFLRNSQVFTRMVALPWSALWQTTEIATAMLKYGALRTINHAIKQMPGFKQLLRDAAHDPATSQRLNDVLARNSNQTMRLRPFVQRLEDGYEIPESAILDMRLQQAQQLVPYSNALKWVHGFQANLVGNLVTDVVVSAAKGDAKAAAQLAKYGVDAPALAKIKASVDKVGLEVDQWDFAAWDAARPALSKMMDEAVLSQRLGDTPAFAMLNPVGKYIFTFRSFTLTAHNKVLAGTLGRDGLAATSLLMLYQFPMAALAVQAQAALNKKPELEGSDLALKAMGQMGAFGWFTDAIKIYSGDMQNFGNPAMIAGDRVIRVGNDISNLDFGQAMEDGVKLVPHVGLASKAIGAALGE